MEDHSKQGMFAGRFKKTMKKEIVFWRTYPDKKPLLDQNFYYLCQTNQRRSGDFDRIKKFVRMYWSGVKFETIQLYFGELGYPANERDLISNIDIIAWTSELDGIK